MPRQTQRPVSSGVGKPYADQPSVGLSGPIPHAIADQSAGLEGISRALSGFFGDVVGALGTVQEAEHLKRRVEIEQENQTQQWEGRARALEGGELSPQEMGDLDFVTPYNETKAGVAAMEDGNDFLLNVLPNLGIEADPFQALSQYMGWKLKGIENKQFAAFYMNSMLKGTSEAIAKNRADLITSKQFELQNDWKTKVGLDLKTSQINDVSQLMQVISSGAKLRDPMNPREGERWAAGQLLTIARGMDADGTILNRVTTLLQQPVAPTEDNPNGLSFATRFPDGFNALVADAEKNMDVGFEKAIENHAFKIDQSLAAGNLDQALVDLTSARGLYGDNKFFRARELQIINGIESTAAERGATQRLLGATASGFVPQPDDISKYGDKVITQVLQSQGPVKAASLMTAWNAIPPDFQKSLEGNLTKNAEAAATYYTTVVRPMFETMPATMRASLSEDAQFVYEYMRGAEVLGNANPLASAQDAIAALNSVKQSGLDAKSVKLWDSAKQGAQDDYMSDLREDLASNLGVDKVDERLIQGTFLPAIKQRALRYMAAGDDPLTASQKATEEIVESGAARVARLPAADGGLYAAEDIAPDVAVKWQPRTLPDGSTYDPVEEFRTESTRPILSFLNDGEAMELRPGIATAADGAMDVWGSDGLPIRLEAGQSFTFEVPYSSSFTDQGFGASVAKETLVVPQDEVAAENMLTEMFGDTGFRLARVGDGRWQVQYVAQQKSMEDLKALELRRELENEIVMEDAQRANTGDPLPADAGLFEIAEYAKEVTGANLTSDQLALRDVARDLISKMQDSGMIPAGTGITKPLPPFNSGEEVMAYISGEILRGQQNRNGLPVEPKNAMVDDKYVTVRSRFLKSVEGVRNRVYDDTKGHATVGVGINLDAQYNVDFLKSIGVDVAKLRAGEIELTDEQVDLSFENAVGVAEEVVSRRIKVPLNAHQRTALVSLAYNGPSLLTDELVAAVNGGDWGTAVQILESNGFNNSRRRKEAKYLGRGVDTNIISGGEGTDDLRGGSGIDVLRAFGADASIADRPKGIDGATESYGVPDAKWRRSSNIEDSRGQVRSKVDKLLLDYQGGRYRWKRATSLAISDLAVMLGITEEESLEDFVKKVLSSKKK